MLGLVPGLPGRALGVVPAALQVVLGLVPAFARVLLPRLPAVLVGGLVVLVVTAALGGVGTRLVVLTPVGVLLGGIDGFGDAVADEATGNRSNSGSDQRTDDRSAYRGTDGSTRS